MKAILLGSLAVLADTVSLRRNAFRSAFREHGLAFPNGHNLGLGHFARYAQQRGEERAIPVGSLLDARNHYFAKALAKGPLRPRAGLHDLIDAAGRSGIALGLVVGTPAAWTQAVFEGLDLMPEVFDTIVSTDHVVAPKPAADCYHFAAAMLATAPEDCLALEDTRSGVTAARGAGLSVMDLSDRNGGMTEPLPGLAEALRGGNTVPVS